MATAKQIAANQKNALLSTGPVSPEGKAMVACNAIKHGIFTRELIIDKGDGREDGQEYSELLSNLVQSLSPRDQMQQLLVEKIATDYWRLRRVLRYETGSIRQNLDTAIDDYYTGSERHKTNIEIDKEIEEQKGYISWNNRYIKCLKNGIVSFDKPEWGNDEIKTNIEDDIFTIAESIKYSLFKNNEYARYTEGKIVFDELKQIFTREGYEKEDISDALIACLKEQNEEYAKKIKGLEQKKYKNSLAEEVCIQVNSIPTRDNIEKIIRYEKTIQRSIIQNLALVKKLQCIQ